MIKSNVKREMDKKRLSIRKLVDQTGLSSGTVHRARGEQVGKCSLTTLERIAKALDVRVKDLFDEV
jgi:DNA-binding Xre family transcriptional regulator